MLQTIEMRFWQKVDVCGPIPAHRPDLGPCWIWTAGLNAYGYGAFNTPGFQWKAHRFAYELLVGRIPEGKQLDHTCHNGDPDCPGSRRCLHRRCVNPFHLEPVTHRENLLRGQTVTASKAAQTHCIWGHEFTPENTRVRKNGTRNCRVCDRTSSLLRVRPSRAKVVV